MPKQEMYVCDLCGKAVPLGHSDSSEYMILHGTRVQRTWKKSQAERDKADFHRVFCDRCQDTLEQIILALDKHHEKERPYGT